MLLSLAEMRQLGADLLEAAGAPAPAAHLQTDLLVDAEARGRASHGLQRLPVIVGRIEAGLTDPVSVGEQRWVAPALLEVDGRGGLGPAVAVPALERACERANETGVAVVAISNANHLGMLGWYAERVAHKKMICIATTTSEALVHPWGGIRPEVGSNPIAIGVPAHPHPFLLDMATSATSMGRVQQLDAAGRPMEPGLAIDSAGRPTTNAAAALAGAISPFGGAKGFALALALEVLVASMTGTAYGREVHGTLDTSNRVTKGDLFFVLKPPADGDTGALTTYLDDVRRSPRASGSEPIRIPGDGGRQALAESTQQGVDVPDSLVHELRALTERFRHAAAITALPRPSSGVTK